MIYNFTLTPAGKQGERGREKLKSGEIKMFVSFLCQQIPEWFPHLDYFSFCDCNNLDG